MSRALDPNPGGARDMEREEITVPRPLEISLMLPAEGFESEFLLKRLCWNCFENAATKAEQLVEVGAKKLLCNRIHRHFCHISLLRLL